MGAADLLASHVVVPRLKPTAGIRPASRLVAGQNLQPRHLLLFMRWLLAFRRKPHKQIGRLRPVQLEDGSVLTVARLQISSIRGRIVLSSSRPTQVARLVQSFTSVLAMPAGPAFRETSDEYL